MARGTATSTMIREATPHTPLPPPLQRLGLVRPSLAVLMGDSLSAMDMVRYEVLLKHRFAFFAFLLRPFEVQRTSNGLNTKATEINTPLWGGFRLIVIAAHARG